MRKVTALCAFALVAAGAASVGAVDMKGSDTLFELFGNNTVDGGGVFGGIIANCTGATGITYVGTGSGNGESAITAHSVQRIAPMSRAVATAAGCATDIGTSKAEGIVFALDGVSINISGEFGAACTGAAGTVGTCTGAGELCVDTNADGNGDTCASGAAQCSPSTNDCNSATGSSGLAYSRTAGSGASGAIAIQDLNGVPGIQCTPHTYAYGADFNTPSATPVAAVTTKVIGCTGGANSSTYSIGVAGGASGDQNTPAFAWRDVLRILLLGMPNGTTKTITNRDCNSDLRWTLANNYAKIFQVDCTNGSCSQIKHIFRRDEFSGTTDVFLATLGMDGIDITKFDGASFTDGTAYKNSRSFFCNVRRNEDTWLRPNDARVKLADGTSRSTASNPPYARNEAVGTPVNVYDTRPYFPEYQDSDPIRRDCDGTNNGNGTTANQFTLPPNVEATEQVCGARGNLGLVLPISMPSSSTANDIRYPVDQCAKGSWVLRVGPIKDNNKCDFCPNGDKCIAGNLCFYPTSAPATFPNGTASGAHKAASTVCINGKDNCPPVTFDASHSVQGLPTDKYKVDCRVYNLTMHNGSSNTDDTLYVSNRTNEKDSGGNVVPTQHLGAYFRIHQTRTVAAPFDGSTCQQNDDTQHIACLVNASKCSLGYTGREGPELQPGTMEAKVNNLEPSTACIRELLNNLGSGDFGNASLNYPMSRKLFLNTMVGFENHTGAANELSSAEYAISQCTAAVSDARVQAFGFISLPNDQANPVLQNPFCQDFDGTGCGANGNAGTADSTDACLNNTANSTTGIPANGRPCKQAAGTVGTLPCLAGQSCVDLNADGIGDQCQ